MTPTPDRRVVLSREGPGGAYVVEVLPAIRDGIGHDASYPDYKSARTYARTLSRTILGLPFEDMCEPDLGEGR